MLLRAKYLVDAQSYSKIQGRPFKQAEIEAKIEEILGQDFSPKTLKSEVKPTTLN
jgi:hypothetical protein